MDFRKVINIGDYNYDLQDNRIAQYPLPERDGSKLLIWKDHRISSGIFKNIASYIPTGSLMVMNVTRVIRARLLFNKKSGARIEILLIEPVSPSDYGSSFSSAGPVEWKCIVGNMKKWKTGTISMESGNADRKCTLSAEKIGADGDAWRIRFAWDNPALSFYSVIEAAGHVPLPPYITRSDIENDKDRYQTVYSELPGSVAAPTAGLHFTPQVIAGLVEKGIKCTGVTLHVGAGTFQPVRVRNAADHIMHHEHFSVTKAALDEIIENLGHIVAVGTTSVRTIESLYWLGVKIIRNWGDPTSVGQWEPYREAVGIAAEESLAALAGFIDKNGISCLKALTGIMIIPGYKFRITDAIITNFHQPGSTLLLLISAWTGDNWKKIYSYAADNGFRFLSYGDSSLLFR
ncbi:MAG: S-adenosylmethionine:tRNA ribosyltransferase-isomerase [Bacteroidales bacterium]